MSAADVLGLAGRHAVVTGASSGIGAAAVEVLLEAGAVVTGLDRREPAAARHRHVGVDLGDPASVDAAVAAVDGPVDALYHCAGLPNTFPAEQVVRVNFAGLRHLSEGLLDRIPAGGSITSVSSMAAMGLFERLDTVLSCVREPGFAGVGGWVARNPEEVADGYAFSKECIVAWTMLESVPMVRERGIRLNAVSPGPTDTPMMGHFERAQGKDFMDAFPKPIGRNSTPREQAAALVFLGSPAAAYVVGANLAVDGGFLAAVSTGQVDLAALAG